MAQHCFTYGSLMWADIMARVTGATLTASPATLPDHARHPVQGEDYPGMRPCPGAQVQGLLYRNLDEAALGRLDAFEGAEYLRSKVRVVLDDGQETEAWAYLYRSEFLANLRPEEWDVRAFEQTGKARFMARYIGFHAVLPPV